MEAAAMRAPISSTTSKCTATRSAVIRLRQVYHRYAQRVGLEQRLDGVVELETCLVEHGACIQQGCKRAAEPLVVREGLAHLSGEETMANLSRANRTTMAARLGFQGLEL